MESLIGLVNRIQRACTVLGDHGGEGMSLWEALPSVAVVGGQVTSFAPKCCTLSVPKRLSRLHLQNENLKKNTFCFKKKFQTFFRKILDINEFFFSFWEKVWFFPYKNIFFSSPRFADGHFFFGTEGAFAFSVRNRLLIGLDVNLLAFCGFLCGSDILFRTEGVFVFSIRTRLIDRIWSEFVDVSLGSHLWSWIGVPNGISDIQKDKDCNRWKGDISIGLSIALDVECIMPNSNH